MIKTYQDDVEANENDEEDEEEEEEEEEEHSDDDDQSEYDDDKEEDEEEEQASFKQDPSKNSLLAVGYKDRSFVVRGNKIGVFKHADRERLDFSTTIKNIADSKGKEINPSRVSYRLFSTVFSGLQAMVILLIEHIPSYCR